MKGSFGPWKGSFGNKYSNESVLRNFCGLLEAPSNYRINSVMSRLRKRINAGVDVALLKPVFPLISVSSNAYDISITWAFPRKPLYSICQSLKRKLIV